MLQVLNKTKVEREAVIIWHHFGEDWFSWPIRGRFMKSYLMILNKLPVKERLFKIQLSKYQYCLLCFGAEIHEISLVFISCDKVFTHWRWTRDLCLFLLGNMLLTMNLCWNYTGLDPPKIMKYAGWLANLLS